MSACPVKSRLSTGGGKLVGGDKKDVMQSQSREEQIAYALRQAEAGTPVGDVCRQLGVSEASFYVWKRL